MATSINFPVGVVTAIQQINLIPFPFDAGVPGNPVIPGNPVFPETAPAAPVISALFGVTETVDVLGVAPPHFDIFI